jgi:hypothetical protein
MPLGQSPGGRQRSAAQAERRSNKRIVTRRNRPAHTCVPARARPHAWAHERLANARTTDARAHARRQSPAEAITADAHAGMHARTQARTRTHAHTHIAHTRRRMHAHARSHTRAAVARPGRRFQPTSGNAAPTRCGRTGERRSHVARAGPTDGRESPPRALSHLLHDGVSTNRQARAAAGTAGAPLGTHAVTGAAGRGQAALPQGHPRLVWYIGSIGVYMYICI